MDVTLAMFPKKKKGREKRSRVILDKFLSLFGLEQPSLFVWMGKGLFQFVCLAVFWGVKKEIRSLWLIFFVVFWSWKGFRVQCLKWLNLVPVSRNSLPFPGAEKQRHPGSGVGYDFVVTWITSEKYLYSASSYKEFFKWESKEKNTSVITPIRRMRSKQRDEPIRIPINSL